VIVKVIGVENQKPQAASHSPNRGFSLRSSLNTPISRSFNGFDRRPKFHQPAVCSLNLRLDKSHLLRQIKYNIRSE
jgi:hypothetical protein